MARRDYLIYRLRHSTPGSMPFAIRTSSGNLTICSAIAGDQMGVEFLKRDKNAKKKASAKRAAGQVI